MLRKLLSVTFTLTSLTLVSTTPSLAQWTGPSYAYDGSFPAYVIENSVTGDGSTEGSPSSLPWVRARSGVSGGSGTAVIHFKFKAQYSAAPGTPAKTIETKSDFTGSKTVTGTGTGKATCKGVNNNDGSVLRDTDGSGNPISPVTNSIGTRSISGPSHIVSIEAYAHATSNPGSNGTASASAETVIWTEDD